MSPVAEYIKNVGKSVAYAAYDYTTNTMPATSEFMETNDELFSDVYHSVTNLRSTMNKALEAIQNTPLYRHGSTAFHNAMEDIKSGNLYNAEREDSIMGEAFNMDDDFNMDSLDSGDSSSGESSITVGEKSIMAATQESANQISHTTASAIEASTNYSVNSARQNATMLYAQSVKTNATLEGGFKAITTGLETMYKFNTEVVQTMANNSKVYFETTTKIMQENNAILKEMLEMQRNLYKRDNKAKSEDDPLFAIMGTNGGIDIKAYGKQLIKNAKSVLSEKTMGMSDMISEDMLKQVAANPLQGIPSLMIATALGPAIKSTMQNFDKTLGGMFGSFISKMNYMASNNSWGGSMSKEIMGKLFGVQLSAKESINTSDVSSKITPMERSVVEVIPSHLSRIEAALTGNPARIYDAKKGKWTNMAAIKADFKKDKEDAIRSAGYEETSEMKDIMNKLVGQQVMNREQVKHMEEVIQKINRKRFDDGGWLDRKGTVQDKAMRYGVSEEEWNLYEQLYSNISRGARANAPGKFMRERLERNRKLKNAEASGNDVLRLLFNDFDPANSLHIDSKKLKETGGTLGQNILETTDKHGMTVFDYLREIDLNTMYGGGGGGGHRSRRKGTDDRSLREQELANRHANGMREGAAAGGDRTITIANAGNESDNSRQINNLNINQADLITAAGAVKDERREQQMEENRTFITRYINQKMATEVQKMKADGASAEEIAKYRESMMKMVDTASEGGQFGAMTEAIQHLAARPVGVITGIMEQADKHIFNTLFEEEDRDDKDEEGKPAKGFFGKLKNRLDEMFQDIKDKINKRDEEIGNTNLSLFQKANAIIKEYTGVDVSQNLKNMKQGIINTGKSAFNEVKSALEGTAKDIGLEKWVDKLGQKKDKDSNTDDASQTKTAADGARNVTKTGLTILSKGERVIPADQNIYNPDMRKVNRAENRRDEAQIKRQLINQIRDANMMADGGTIDENGKAVKDSPEEKSLFAQFGERLGIWDNSNDKKVTSMTQKEVEKYLPSVAGGGTAGAVFAAATGLGGPLVGAIAGAAIDIAANSESFQKRLFGERIYDESTGADTGKRKGGLFGQEIRDTMSKYLPDAKNYGITGSLLGLVTPLGPLGGLMMGGAISFLKNNEKANNTLFGENGLIGKDAQKTLKKAFPAASKTAIAGILAGGLTGIGLIPGALVGAGIGLVSTTDEFKDFLLGKPDKDGKRVGGVAGAIKEGLVDPLKEVGQSVKDNFLDWFKTKMTKPIVDAMAPTAKQLQLGITGVFNWGKNLAKRIAGSRTGIGLMNRMRYSKAGRAAGWLGGKAFGAVKGVGSAAKWVAERPSALIGKMGDRLRKSQIKSGNADYMTAEERLKFMGDEDYDMRSFDEAINGTTNEGIEEIRKKFGEIDEGKDFLEKEHTAQIKKIGKHVVKGVKDTGRATQIMDSIRSGNMKRAVKLVESSKMSQRDKYKMLEFINEEGEKLRDIAMRKDNFKADRGAVIKQLEKMGMTGINENNYEKYKKYFETEAAKRSNQDKENSEALDTTDPAAMQAAEINMTLKTGFDEQIPLLQKMTDYLGMMVEGKGGMTPDQAKALQDMKQAGLKAEVEANKKRRRNARKKTNILNRAFGGTTKITDENQLNFLDTTNSERKHLLRIADNGLQLDDVNKVLELKGKDKERWFTLADYGYNITDIKLIHGMSNHDFDKLMILAKAGIPITNIKAISKYDEHECELMAKFFGNGMEIAQGGLYEFARKGEMTKEEFATKKAMVNNLEGSYEERIGLNRQEGVEQFSKHHTKQSKLARMGESMKDSAKGMVHAAMADTEQKLYARIHGYNNRNRKSGAINNAGLAKKGTGAIKAIASGKDVNILEGMSTEDLAAVASSPAAIPAHADGGKVTKDEVAVVSKGERIEPADSDKEKAAPPAQAQKKESELDKATKETKKDKKKNTSTVNTEYGPQEYKMSSDGSMVVAKTKQSMAVQKRILDRDNTQKELLATIKELVDVNKESLKNSLAGIGRKAKKGLFDLLKDLNPLNMVKKFGGAIASALGPLAPLVLKGIGAIAKLPMKGIKWAGGKVLDGVKAVGSKIMNTKIGRKIANSKIGRFASKIGGKLFGSKGDGDVDTSTPTNELDAINIHGSNIEKLLTKILNALEGNDGGAEVPGITIGGKKRRRKGAKGKKGGAPSTPADAIPDNKKKDRRGKKGEAPSTPTDTTPDGKKKTPSTPAEVTPGNKKKRAKGRIGKLLTFGGAVTAGLGFSNLFGGSGDEAEDNGENKPEYTSYDENMDNAVGETTGGNDDQISETEISDFDISTADESQMALANNNSSSMDIALDVGANAMYTKEAVDIISKTSSKFANMMNKGKNAVGNADNATKENTLAIVQKVKSGFNTVISKCGVLIGGAAGKLTAFKDWIIKKITTPASMKKILAKAGKHAAAYGASATGIGTVITIGLEVGFAMSAFYDGYNDADRILKIPAGTATTGMKMLCGFVSAALQAIPIIGWVLEPEDVIQGAISTVGAVFGVSEDILNQVRKVGDKADKGISQVTNKIAETAQKAQSAATSVFNNIVGYGQDLFNQGQEKAQSVWDKFTGYGSDLVSKAGGMASKAANWVKDKAGAAVQGAKDMAVSVYQTAVNTASGAVDAVKSGAQKAKDAVANEYQYAKNKVKSVLGFGKWGRGFQSQQDPSIAGQSFNVAGDTSPETVDERACAETTGVNVLSALGMPTSSNDVLDAVDFAAGRGHVAPDDGTKDTFFKDYLGQYGVQTRHINPNSAANTNNPVILMGKDKSNTPDKEAKGLSKTPYGDQPHYVLGMGTDKNGDMTVVDPDTPDATPQKYRASDVLSHSSLAIEAGMGKFNKRLGRKKWGKGPTIDENPPFGSVASAIASKVGSDHPELFWAQMMVETGGPEAERKWMQDHPQYGDICNYGGFTWYPGMGEEYKGPPRPDNEGGYYAKFKSDAEYADMAYRKVYQSYQDEIKQATNAKEFAHILKSHGYFASDEDEYAAGLQARLDQYKDQLGALGKNMVPSGATSNSSGGASQFGGIFGDLADAASALSDGFSIGGGKGKWCFGRGKDDNDVLAAVAANADALAPKKTDDSQKPNDISKIVDYQTAMEYIQEVPPEQIAEYNRPNQNDSITVLRAKCKKIREIFEQKQQNGKGKKSILGRAKRALSKNPVIQAFNEYMNGRGPKVAYGGKGKWGKGEGAHIWDYLKQKGLGSSAIAGIMGNMQAESSLEPNIVQGGGHADQITVDGTTGYGLCQWTSSGRQQGLLDFANSRGTKTSDTDTQLEFMLKEINDGYNGLLQKMDGMSPYDAALLFHKEFERSSDTSEMAARRGQFAEEIAKSEGKGESFNGTYSGGTATKKRGLFGKLTEMATALSDKMKKAIAPMAGAITSGAEKIFGKENITAIFGDANPFSSIFSSPSGGGNGNGGSGSFASASSDAGIRKASEYAQSRVGTEGYGNNGCTTWCRVYLKQAGNPFADEMSLYVPTLMEQAKQKGIWKEPDQPGCEGDIALLESVGDRSDGPDHAVIYDGRGGCWGNSSSKNKILHYDNMLASFPGGLWGYVATGSGGGTVATKEGEGQSAEDAALDSTMDGHGKWSGKWGKGRKRPLRLSATARAKYGKGLLDLFKSKQRDPKKELEMQDKLVGNKRYDANDDHGIKTMEDVAAYIKDIPKASIPEYNRIKNDDSLTVARAKAIKAKQMFEEQSAKDPKANPSIKMMEDVSKMPQNTLAQTNSPVVSDPDNPLSGNDGINSVESAREYISGLPEDYKNSIPKYNVINDDDSITVARAKALKTMELYKKTAKNQPQETTPAPAEGKGKWGRSWLSRIGGAIGDVATGLWNGISNPSTMGSILGGITGTNGPVVPFLKPVESKDTKDKKSLADEFENDIKYIMSAKEWQDKDGRNPSRTEAIEILKKEEKYKGKINDDGTIKDESTNKTDDKKAENQKAAEKIDTSYTENDVTYIMTAREWQDSEGRNPSRAEAEKILQEQGKTGKGKWGRSWLSRIGGAIGDVASGLWKGITSSGNFSGVPFLKPVGSKDGEEKKKSLTDEFENDIKYIMTAKEWQGSDGRNPSRAEAIEILKKEEKYKGKINDDGTIKDESTDAKKAENQKAAEKIDTSYTENDVTYIMTAREWQDSEGRNPSRAEAEKILQEQGKAGKGKWGRLRQKVSPVVEQKKPSFWERISSIIGPSRPNNYAKFADDHGIRSMQDALDYVKDIPADFQAKYPDNIINPDKTNGDSILVARSKAVKMRELWEQEHNTEGRVDKRQSRNRVEQVTQPVNAVMTSLPSNPLQTENNGLNTMQDCLNLQSTIPEDFIAKYPFNRIDPANDSMEVAQAKATKLSQLYNEQSTTQTTPSQAPSVDVAPTETPKMTPMEQILDSIKDIPEDFIAKYPYNRIDPVNDSMVVAKAKADALRKLYDSQPAAGMGKWGHGIDFWLNRLRKSIGNRAIKIRHSITGQKQPTQPVNAVMTQAPALNPFQTKDDPHGLNTMQDCLNLQSTIPEDFIAKYPYNRIDPANDSMTVARAKASKLAQLYKEQSAVVKPVETVPTPPTVPTVQNQTEDNPYGNLNTMQDCLNLQSTIPEDFIAQYPYNRIDPEKDSMTVAKAKATKLAQLYNQQPAAQGKWGRGVDFWLNRLRASVGDRAIKIRHSTGQKQPVPPTTPEKKEPSKEQTLDKSKPIEKKSANDVAKEAVKNPGTVKTQAITNPDDIKSVEDAFNYISDIPEDFIEKYPFNKIDPEKDDLVVIKAKATKLRKLYDDELAKSGTTKMESKMAAQTIDPNKPAETNTTEKNAQNTAEKAGIVEKKEEKETSTTKSNDAVSDDSGITAPNGQNYSNNDINYLIKQGYSKEAAIELLSKDKKYAVATPTTTKTSDTKSADSSNATGSGEYNDKFDTMINLLASIAQSVAAMAGMPAPQVVGATANGAKGNTALQQKTDAKVQANRKAAAQVSGQNMQDMFAGIASAMQKLARG